MFHDSLQQTHSQVIPGGGGYFALSVAPADSPCDFHSCHVPLCSFHSSSNRRSMWQSLTHKHTCQTHRSNLNSSESAGRVLMRCGGVVQCICSDIAALNTLDLRWYEKQIHKGCRMTPKRVQLLNDQSPVLIMVISVNYIHFIHSSLIEKMKLMNSKMEMMLVFFCVLYP